VAEELKKIQKQSQEDLKIAQSKISELTDERIGKHDSISLQQRLQELNKILDSRPNRGLFDQQTTKVRDALVQCFKDNHGKPLKCQQEFENFRGRVKVLTDSQ
jgi:altered-inheritance-of-mitochondria protein 13